MAENERKLWQGHLPAILTAATAFLAGVSTIYMNVRNDFREPAKPGPLVAAGPLKPLTTTPLNQSASPAKQPMLVQLERIEVLNDGSYGSTDWTFRVEADGRELFSLPSKRFSDKPGGNVVIPTTDDGAQGKLELLPGQEVLIKVIGKGASDELIGTGTFSAAGLSGPIRVEDAKGGGPGFVFRFVAKPVAPASDAAASPTSDASISATSAAPG